MPTDLVPPPETVNADGTLLVYVITGLVIFIVGLLVDRKLQEKRHREERGEWATRGKERWKEITTCVVNYASLSERVVASNEKVIEAFERMGK